MKALQRDIDQFAHDNPDPKSEHFDSETGRYTLAIKFREEPDAESWGIQLGDTVHNLRCALDHVVWQLVLLNGERPGHHTSWPAGMTGEYYWSPRKNGRPSLREETLRGVADEPRALIDQLQPYRGGTEVHRHFLSVLVPLSNADKHRIVQAGFLAIEEPPDQFMVRNQDVGDVLEGTFAAGPLKDNANVMECRVAITGPNPHVYMQRDLTLIVGFGEQHFAWGAIQEMAIAVGQTIEAFDGFFNPQEPYPP